MVYLYFVCIDNPDVNISRLSNRVALGGHDVPEAKVKERYFRTLKAVHLLLPHCYSAYLFDNSGKRNQLIAALYKGDIELKTDKLPQWFFTLLCFLKSIFWNCVGTVGIIEKRFEYVLLKILYVYRCNF